MHSVSFISDTTIQQCNNRCTTTQISAKLISNYIDYKTIISSLNEKAQEVFFIETLSRKSIKFSSPQFMGIIFLTYCLRKCQSPLINKHFRQGSLLFIAIKMMCRTIWVETAVSIKWHLFARVKCKKFSKSNRISFSWQNQVNEFASCLHLWYVFVNLSIVLGGMWLHQYAYHNGTSKIVV